MKKAVHRTALFHIYDAWAEKRLLASRRDSKAGAMRELSPWATGERREVR